jgi:hypothetical protein
MVRAIAPTKSKETIEPSTFKNRVRRPMDSRLIMGQKKSSNTVKMFLLEMIQFL